MARLFFRSIWRSEAALFVGALCAVLLFGVASSRTSPLLVLPDLANSHVSLSEVEHAVRAIHPVPELTGAEVERMLGRQQTVLFDVRESREFEASHLPSAIHVDPNESGQGFLAKNREKLRGRVAIFYCAVGVRSSLMLERVASLVGPYDAVAFYNLRGGIFRWFAEGRAVVDANGPALRIDPYDDSWGKLLQRTLDARS